MQQSPAIANSTRNPLGICGQWICKATQKLSHQNVKKPLAICLMMILFFLAGCLKTNLPHKFEVETAILKRTDFNKPVIVVLPKEMRLKLGSLAFKETYENADYAYWVPIAVVFQSAGFVTIEVTESNYFFAGEVSHYIKINLTTEGRVLSSDWEKDPQADDTRISRTFIAGYSVPIAKRKFVEVKRITPLGNDKARVEFDWRWEPSLSGRVFDRSSADYQALSTIAKQCVDKYSPLKINSNKIESAIAIFQFERELWHFIEFASPLL